MSGESTHTQIHKSVVAVHLRPITKLNLAASLQLELSTDQSGLVTNNAKSLAEAYVSTELTPLAIYDAAALGYEEPLPVPMIGFAMYEIEAGVGFISRLMIDHRFQRQGYGKAAMQELVRRLRLDPRVEIIATSYRHGNHVAAELYRSLGFKAWDIEWARNHETDTFLRLSS